MEAKLLLYSITLSLLLSAISAVVCPTSGSRSEDNLMTLSQHSLYTNFTLTRVKVGVTSSSLYLYGSVSTPSYTVIEKLSSDAVTLTWK